MKYSLDISNFPEEISSLFPFCILLFSSIENNRIERTRDLFKKIRDTKGTFHAKMGTIRDRNGVDLTEAEDIKKRWQEYTELSKKVLMTCITMMVWSLS